MSDAFYIQVLDQSAEPGLQTLFQSVVSESFRIGRQEVGDPPPLALLNTGSSDGEPNLKLIAWSSNSREFSRRFAHVECRDGVFEIHNTSSNQRIYCGSGDPIEPGESRVFSLPFDLILGDHTIEFSQQAIVQPKSQYQMIGNEESRANLAKPRLPPALSLMCDSSDTTGGRQRLLELLQAMLATFQDAPNRQEFFDQAAVSMARLLELDHVMILFDSQHVPKLISPTIGQSVRELENGWCSQAFHDGQQRTTSWSPSLRILNSVRATKKTIFLSPEVRAESLMRVDCLVASPLFNSQQDVIGVIYADRSLINAGEYPFTENDAMFVELFANAISVGLQRLHQDSKLSEMRARFDQFFTADLARQIESDPTLLEPKSAQVSILFADIRGFSRIAERIGPDRTIKWINSVLSQLSDCVFENGGVVVDYIGDEIMAMWGAPLIRQNHAELAVRTAIAMFDRLPAINQQWAEEIGETFDLGIGINTGEAQVGNTGSERKFKYGPLGDVVNVSSRLQSATKQLQARLLVTESTARQLPAEIYRRKIRTIRFVNVERAIGIYEIPVSPDDDWVQLQEAYDAGLASFERNDLAVASQQLASIVSRFPHDGPTMMLLSDAVKSLQMDKASFDPVWILPQK